MEQNFNRFKYLLDSYYGTVHKKEVNRLNACDGCCRVLQHYMNSSMRVVVKTSKDNLNLLIEGRQDIVSDKQAG